MSMATGDSFDEERGPRWADWKAAYGSRQGEDVWHATLDLPDGRRWYARWDPAIDRGILIRTPWTEGSPVRDLGWWPDQQAFSQALHSWVTEGIPLGPDNTLPKPRVIDGPAVPARPRPPGMEPPAGPAGPGPEPPPAGPPAELPPSPPDIGEANTRDAFFNERPSRGIGDHDYGYFWQDPTGTLEGTWRLTWSEAAREAWIIQLPDTPTSTVIPLGQWHSRPEFVAAIPDWPARGNLQGLDWLLRSTGNAHILDQRPEGTPMAESDPVPSWAPEGSVGHIDAKLMRKVLAGAMASSGDTLERLCQVLELDPDWAARVIDGRVDSVPATVAVGLAAAVGACPEDLFGPQATAGITWVTGAQPTIAQALGAQRFEFGPEP